MVTMSNKIYPTITLPLWGLQIIMLLEVGGQRNRPKVFGVWAHGCAGTYTSIVMQVCRHTGTHPTPNMHAHRHPSFIRCAGTQVCRHTHTHSSHQCAGTQAPIHHQRMCTQFSNPYICNGNRLSKATPWGSQLAHQYDCSSPQPCQAHVINHGVQGQS